MLVLGFCSIIRAVWGLPLPITRAPQSRSWNCIIVSKGVGSNFSPMERRIVSSLRPWKRQSFDLVGWGLNSCFVLHSAMPGRLWFSADMNSVLGSVNSTSSKVPSSCGCISRGILWKGEKYMSRSRQVAGDRKADRW